MRNSFVLAMSLFMIFLLAGCLTAAAPVPPPAAAPTPAAPSAAPSPTLTMLPVPAASPSPAAPASTATNLPAAAVCSPLQDIPLARLSEIISNPYHPPQPGSDDPHHGVDLADLLAGSQVAVAGRPVQAALAGQVAAVIQDRFPYGNAILIETPLEETTAGWRDRVQIPAAAPTPARVSPLTCPPASEPFNGAASRSIYVLYAHLQAFPALRVEDIVTCGQTIGAIGSSGNALNPHLHLEVRVGPAGLRMTSMAHYDASATLEEMSNYCLWRISGWFQMIDPFMILNSGQ